MTEANEPKSCLIDMS